jgi:hypothetical protein
MSGEASIEDKLYPSSAATPGQHPAAATSAPSAGPSPAAKADDGGTPAKAPAQAEKATTDGDATAKDKAPGDVLFSPESVYGSGLQEGLSALTTEFDFTPEQAAQVRAQTAELFSELEIPPAEAQQAHALYVQYITAPADEATAQAWAKDARKELVERFGPDEAQKRLAAAREYVAGRKELHTLLHFSGLGSHPKVVVELAERAYRLRGIVNAEKQKKAAADLQAKYAEEARRQKARADKHRVKAAGK